VTADARSSLFAHERRSEDPAEAGFPGADDGIRTRDLHLGKVKHGVQRSTAVQRHRPETRSELRFRPWTSSVGKCAPRTSSRRSLLMCYS
jgi:hypothetical protein